MPCWPPAPLFLPGRGTNALSSFSGGPHTFNSLVLDRTAPFHLLRFPLIYLAVLTSTSDSVPVLVVFTAPRAWKVLCTFCSLHFRSSVRTGVGKKPSLPHCLQGTLVSLWWVLTWCSRVAVDLAWNGNPSKPQEPVSRSLASCKLSTEGLVSCSPGIFPSKPAPQWCQVSRQPQSLLPIDLAGLLDRGRPACSSSGAWPSWDGLLCSVLVTQAAWEPQRLRSEQTPSLQMLQPRGMSF